MPALQHTASPPRPHPAIQAQVRKKLDSGRPGTRAYQRQFGDALVCVRYRHHPESGKRYTTVEIVVDERQHSQPIQPTPQATNGLVGIHIDYAERELRNRVKASGAQWDANSKLWLMPHPVAKALNLLGRIGSQA